MTEFKLDQLPSFMSCKAVAPSSARLVAQQAYLPRSEQGWRAGRFGQDEGGPPDRRQPDAVGDLQRGQGTRVGGGAY